MKLKNLFKLPSKLFRRAICCTLLACSIVSSPRLAWSQGNASAPISTVGQYTPYVIPLGFKGINATNFTLTIPTTNTTILTNTTVLFTNNTGSGSPGFVTNTTTTTNTSVVYPWANFAFQSSGAFQFNFLPNASAATTATNVTVYLAHSVDGVWTNLTTNSAQVYQWVIPIQGGAQWQGGTTNFTGLGDGWWAPIAFFVADTNVADYLTNLIFQTAVKKLPR